MSYYIYEIASTLRRYLKPVRDDRYLRFIRTFPCVACSSHRHIEAAHIGPHAYSEKADDWTALPLCAECHREGPEALHTLGPEVFQIRRGIVFAALQAMFARFYFLKTGQYPAGWPDEQERHAA